MITTESPGELITLDEMERRYVRQVLDAVGGNKTHAARILGIDRRSLYRRLEEPKDEGDRDARLERRQPRGVGHARDAARNGRSPTAHAGASRGELDSTS